MTRRTKLLIGLGVGIAAATGIRHCLRSMGPSGSLADAIDACRHRSAACCQPVESGCGEGADQCRETTAAAA